MENNNKDSLFMKVSIENIKNGEVAKIGLQKFGLLMVIASFADDKGFCFPSQDTLAELCGIGRKRINVLIKELCEYRTEEGKRILIKKTVRKGATKTVSEYTVTSSAGVTFGSRKVTAIHKRATTELSEVVLDTIQRNKEVIMGCVKYPTKVVPYPTLGLSRIRPLGCPLLGILTKSIELNPLELNPLEQERSIKESTIYIKDKKELKDTTSDKETNKIESTKNVEIKESKNSSEAKEIESFKDVESKRNIKRRSQVPIKRGPFEIEDEDDEPIANIQYDNDNHNDDKMFELANKLLFG